MSVKRYSAGYRDSDGYRYLSMLEKDDGGYVRHEDYAESERYGRAADITIENLERKVEQLAAENSALKELIEQHAGSVAVCPNCSHEEPSETDDIVALYRSMETPATDAILAEVRASGVEMFAASLKVVGPHEHPYSVVADEFAAKIRQEAK